MVVVETILKIFHPCLVRQPLVGQGLFIMGLHDHTLTYHTRQGFSGRVISPTQKPLPDNTQHSQETDIHAPAGFELWIPVRERPHRPPSDNHRPWEKQCLMFALSIFCALSCQQFTNPDIAWSVQTHAVTSNGQGLFAWLQTPLFGIVWTDGYSQLQDPEHFANISHTREQMQL